MSNRTKTLYTGVSNNIVRRILEHKKEKIKGFTQKYKLTFCVYYEWVETIEQAIIREKQIKNMSRKEKLALIQKKNPLFQDLFGELSVGLTDPNDIVTYDEIGNPEGIPDKPE